MVGRPWFKWLWQQVGENACPGMKSCCSSGWFQVIFQLCGGLRHMWVGCWHVISCSVVLILCLLHSVE